MLRSDFNFSPFKLQILINDSENPPAIKVASFEVVTQLRLDEKKKCQYIFFKNKFLSNYIPIMCIMERITTNTR